MFEAAAAEHKRRLEIIGRTYQGKKELVERQVKTRFHMLASEKKQKDPYEHAAYLYSLIESED